MWTPGNLNEFTLSTVPKGVVSRAGANSGLAMVPRTISLVLLVFSSMLFSNDKAKRLSKKTAMLELYDFGWKVSDRVASSTYLTAGRPAVRPSMSTRKDRGPNQAGPKIACFRAQNVHLAAFVLATALPSGAAPECPLCNSHTFKDRPMIKIFRNISREERRERRHNQSFFDVFT